MKTRRDFLKTAALAPLAAAGLVAMPTIARASSKLDPRTVEEADGARKVEQLLNSPTIVADIEFQWTHRPERWHCDGVCFILNCTGIRLFNPNEDPNYYYTVPADGSVTIGLIPRIWCKETGCPDEYCTVDSPGYGKLISYGSACRAVRNRNNPKSWESWAGPAVTHTVNSMKCPETGYFNFVADWLERMTVQSIETKLKYSKYQLGVVKVDYSEVNNSIQYEAPNSIRSYVEYRHKRKQSGLENVSVYFKQC